MEGIEAARRRKKRIVDEADKQINRLEGQEQTLLDGLFKKAQVTTEAQAEKKLAALTKTIDADEAALKTGHAELDEEYKWGEVG